MSLRKTNEILADVVALSSCDDGEQSAEYKQAAKKDDRSARTLAGGHFTRAVLESVESSSSSSSRTSVTYANLLKSVDASMRAKRLRQRPVLSYSSERFDPAVETFAVRGPKKGAARAVLIGINYAGMGEDFELDGAHNDVFRVKTYLTTQGYSEKDVAILIDDGKHVSPTSANIWNALLNLVDQSVSGDYAFVHISAHGIQVDDVDKDETDGHDEVIVTLDSENSILDDYLYSHFVCAMKTGVHLTILCDTCNSGSIFDLPFQKHA